MSAVLWIVLTYPISIFRLRHDLALEVLALHHQLTVRNGRRVCLGFVVPTDLFGCYS